MCSLVCMSSPCRHCMVLSDLYPSFFLAMSLLVYYVYLSKFCLQSSLVHMISLCLNACLSISHFSILSQFIITMSFHLSALISVCLHICRSVCLSVCHLPICLSACLLVCLSAYLPVCLSACLSVYIFKHPRAFLFHYFEDCNLFEESRPTLPTLCNRY